MLRRTVLCPLVGGENGPSAHCQLTSNGIALFNLSAKELERILGQFERTNNRTPICCHRIRNAKIVVFKLQHIKSDNSHDGEDSDTASKI